MGLEQRQPGDRSRSKTIGHAGRLPRHGGGGEPQHHGLRDVLVRLGVAGTIIAGGTFVAIKGASNLNHGPDTPPTGIENVVRGKEFSQPPPLRQPDNPSQIDSLGLPIITEYNNPLFTPGIAFRLKENPPVEKVIQIVTPEGGLTPKQTIETFYPYVSLKGYLIRKEINPDGSVMLAVEIPGKNGLFAQDDMSKSLSSVNAIKDNGNEGTISGSIIWLRLEKQADLIPSFTFRASWNTDFSSRESNKITNDPQEVLRYIRISDPITATTTPALSSFVENQLIENQNKGTFSYEETRKKYSDLAASNRSTIQRMLEDAKSGNVSLKEQLEDKTYILQVNGLDFVPRTQQ